MSLVVLVFVFTLQPIFATCRSPTTIYFLSKCFSDFLSNRFLPFALLTAHGQSNHGEKICLLLICHFVCDYCLITVRPQHRNLTCFARFSYIQILACGCCSWKTQRARVAALVRGCCLEGAYNAGHCHLSSVFTHVVGISPGDLNFIRSVGSLLLWGCFVALNCCN